MIPQSDIDRIELHANTEVQREYRDIWIESASQEAAHWQPIVAELVDKNAAFELSNREKDATISTQAEAIRELVEGLELAQGVYNYLGGDAWEMDATNEDRETVSQLINKHKKP